MCVLGWMRNGDASYSQLNHVVASLGIHVRNQAIDERFGPASSRLMRPVLEETAGQLVEGTSVTTALLGPFSGGVYLQDGTVVSLPDSLSEQWRGSGGAEGRNGSGAHPGTLGDAPGRAGLQEARQSERHGPAFEAPSPADSLQIVDTAYLSYADTRAAKASQRSWITGAKAHMLFRDEQGCWWNLTSWLSQQPPQTQVGDVWVQADKREQVPVRLIAVRLPAEARERRRERASHTVERRPHSKGIRCCRRRPKRQPGRQPRHRTRKRRKVSASKQQLLDWALVLTNVESQKLDAGQVVTLMRLRWQIELFWKLGKQEGLLDTWRSSKPERIVTELYAKLLGLLLSHWLTLEGCWAEPRRSLIKAHQVIQWTASWLVLAIVGNVGWEIVLARMTGAMESNCWTDRRHHPPGTFQQLENPKLYGS